MVDKDKSLKVKSDSIFEKIRDCIRNFFRNNSSLDVEEENALKENIDTKIENINLAENLEKEQDKQNETAKTEFFKLYQDVKSGKIDIDELDAFDVVRVNLMLTQEADIQTNNVHKELEHVQEVNEKIVDIKRKNLIA